MVSYKTALNALQAVIIFVVVFYIFNNERSHTSELKAMKREVEFYRSAAMSLEVEVDKLREDVKQRDKLLNQVHENIESNRLVIRHADARQLDSLITAYLR